MSSIGKLKEASIDLPALRIDIPRIDLYQGNYTTVWFHLMGRSLQVELHITKDGKGRVCMTAEASHHISVVTFDQAYLTPMERKP